jgi:hypothetical protein
MEERVNAMASFHVVAIAAARNVEQSSAKSPCRLKNCRRWPCFGPVSGNTNHSWQPIARHVVIKIVQSQMGLLHSI